MSFNNGGAIGLSKFFEKLPMVTGSFTEAKNVLFAKDILIRIMKKKGIYVSGFFKMGKHGFYTSRDEFCFY